MRSPQHYHIHKHRRRLVLMTTWCMVLLVALMSSFRMMQLASLWLQQLDGYYHDYYHHLHQSVVQESSPYTSSSSSSSSSSSKSTATTTTTTTTYPLDIGKVPVVLLTWVFGKEAIEKTHLRMFVETAQTANVDIVLIGDHIPLYPLPPNVRHHYITWNAMLDRAEETEILNMTINAAVRKAAGYKSIDFKPLMADLFPDLVAPYQFWGHIDNDMLLGDFAAVWTPEYLSTGDIFSARENFTHGPLTLFRKTPILNKLYKLCPGAGTKGANATIPDCFQKVFLRARPWGFDEWDRDYDRRKRPQQDYLSGYSMSAIFKTHRDRLGLRWQSVGYIGWDCPCKWHGRACGCTYDRYNDKSPLVYTNPEIAEKEKNATAALASGRPVYCHYECGKRIWKRDFIDNVDNVTETTFRLQHESLIAGGRFQVDYRKGVRPLLSDA